MFTSHLLPRPPCPQDFCGLARHLQPTQRQSLFSRLVGQGLFKHRLTLLEVNFSPHLPRFQEFCGLARHLQPNQRQSLFSRLVDLGLFNQATRILTYSPAAVKLRATDILLSITQHDVGCLRDFLLHQV